MSQTAHVVPVTVRHHDEVQRCQVDALRPGIPRQDVGIVSGIEQNPSSAVLDQRRITPILAHRAVFAEGVIEYGDFHSAVLAVIYGRERLSSRRSRKNQQCREAMKYPKGGSHLVPLR